MAIHAATTCAASVARRAPCAAGGHLCMLFKGVGDWRRVECAAAAGALAPRSPKTRPASPRPLTPRCCAHSPFAVLPKRPAVRASLRAAPRRPTAAAAAAAPAAAVPAATASQQHNNTLPFVRPGSAGRTAIISLDDQVPAVFVMPPPTGLRTVPLLVPSAPAAYGACTGDAWRATVTYVDLNANVDEWFAGLDTEQCHQVGRGGQGMGCGCECLPPSSSPVGPRPSSRLQLTLPLTAALLSSSRCPTCTLATPSPP